MTLTVYNTRGLKKANSSTVYDTDQIGTVKAFAGKIVPTNWMVAAGQALLRASYPELYSVIGTTYGAGDGSTTFNLPDLRSKFIYGASDPSGNGALGGEATHLLTSGESGMPAHQTGGSSAANPNYPWLPGGASSWAGYGVSGGGSYGYFPSHNMQSNITYLAHDHSHSVAAANAAAAHNNLPPYVLIAQIIKVTGPQIDAGGALIGPAGNASVAMDTWHTVGAAGEPPFLNGWVSTSGGTAKFRKYPDGRVRLIGGLKGGPLGTSAFQLPVGYGAIQNQIIPAAYEGTGGAQAPAEVRVSTDGYVAPSGGSGLSGTVPTVYISLDGVEWDTGLVTQLATGPQGPQGPAGPIGVVQEEGTALAARLALNFIGPTVTAADDAANNRTNVTIAPNKTTVLVGTVGGAIGANQSVTPINAVSVTFIGQQWQAECESYGSFATANMPLAFVLYLDGVAVLNTGYVIGGAPGQTGVYIAQSAVQAAISGAHTITFSIAASNNPGNFANYGQARVTIRHNP